jgi:hypothetical protein
VTTPPRIVTLLLFLMVIAIPLFGVADLLETLRSGFEYLEKTRTGGERAGAGLLYLREFMLLAVVGIFGLWGALIGYRPPRLYGASLFLLSVSIGVLISALYYDPIVLVAGIRQLPYLSLIFVLCVLRRHSDEVQRLFVAATVVAAIAECAVAVIQVFIFLPATNLPILSIRVYGTFNNPNTLGIFLATAVFIVLFFSRFRLAALLLFLGACLATEVVTGSRTGIVASAFVIGAYLWDRRQVFELRWLMMAMFILLLPVMYFVLGALSGRQDASMPLEDQRMKIFFEQIADRGPEELVFGRGLGVGTNTLFSLGRGRPELKPLISILDSTVTALVVQLGFLGVVSFLVAFGALSYRCGYIGWVLFGLMFIAGINVNWLEFYPMNLLFTAAYGIVWAQCSERPRLGAPHAALGPVTDASPA